MRDRRTEQLLLAMLRVNRRSSIADTKELKDLYLPGFGIDFDLG
jgi:hypothetical protein